MAFVAGTPTTPGERATQSLAQRVGPPAGRRGCRPVVQRPTVVVVAPDCSPGPVVLVPEEPGGGPELASVVVEDGADEPRRVVVVDPDAWVVEVEDAVEPVTPLVEVVVVVEGGTVVVVVEVVAGAEGTVA